jgi:uncharacterized protein YfaQ (DUF2300 family)
MPPPLPGQVPPLRAQRAHRGQAGMECAEHAAFGMERGRQLQHSVTAPALTALCRLLFKAVLQHNEMPDPPCDAAIQQQQPVYLQQPATPTCGGARGTARGSSSSSSRGS